MIKFKEKQNNNIITEKHELTNEEINLKIHEMLLSLMSKKANYLSDIYSGMTQNDYIYSKMFNHIKSTIHN